jgi:monoamine oxidase
MMRIGALTAAVILGLIFSTAVEARGSSGGRSHTVKGYTKKDGSYVAPHHRTNPNGSKSDNWSKKGNVNPYTGKKGTKD